MYISNELQQIKCDLQKMQAEIDKLKFHRSTLVTWIGHIIEGDKTSPSIYEASILFDLSKQELRQIMECINHYDGNLELFKTRVSPICDEGIFFIVEGIQNSCSGQLFVNAQKILADYELQKQGKQENEKPN
ncbi:hypothetical protein [Psychrobacter sp. I-STPA10]|uniref:hypothetical protein n=1 Tax=Psychrobacter sp. I-STPA10 TaxID=2585769 RepID=UPI001E29B3DA|nr:hypothetical protein [Psychrobacter sp. I-STPA10]